jgi:hypothetical protein
MDAKTAKELVSDTEVQASAILAVGPAIWKWISDISNIDFLLSINGEKFNMFLSFLQGPGWILLTGIGGVWFGSIIIRRGSPGYVATKSPTWGLVGSSTVVAFLFGVFVAINSSGSVPNIIAGWGSISSDKECNATLDGSRLSSFKKNYKLAIACGINDPSVDHLEDENITISNSYTITPGAIQIVTPLREAMIKQFNAIKEAQLKQLNALKEAQPHLQGSTPITIAVQVQIWYDPILIPNDIPVSKITKLSDVTRLGGKILRQHYFN